MRRTLAAVAIAALAAVATSAGSAGAPASPCAPPLIGVGAIGEGANNPDLMPSTVGQLRILALFVDYPDARGARLPAADYGEAAERLRRWYEQVSYGRLRIDLELVPHWLSMRHPTAHYAGERVREVFAEAVSIVDPEVDFSRVDALYVTPSTGADGGWIVITDDPLSADGKRLGVWGWNPLESAIHEMGHVLGLPDLYVNRVPWTFYRWDVMAGGGRPSGLFAWHRWKLGWLDPTQIACLSARGTVEATVTPVETPGGVKAVVVRTARAAYVAEVRQKIGEDATICKTGVLVYEVDLTGARRPIWLYSALAEDTRAAGSCGGRWRAPFDIGRGQVARFVVGGVRFQLLRKLPDGSYRIRATRSR
jgi:M6 family metalloprotease-like protein